MTAGTILLWRHGQTDFNAAGRLQGQSDIALNATGISQAEAAAARIAELGPARIISSDLQRALRTAAALGELTGVPVEPEPRLRERSFGHWEGLTQAEIEAGWPAAYRAWRQGEEPEGIEADTRVDVGRRVAAALLEAAGEVDDDGVLVAVAHGAAITLGLTHLLDLDAGAWFGLGGLDNCAWALVAPNPGRRPGWRLTAHNLTA
ncbi:probable phosphoglycerate mutase [Georgenia satyanarayanai]|uniref:Probable phosphoglycerate mutase n=1 Tax=Georgenia satyanarayanai TaxID=860221 RepID=A0A2Y9BYW0_9MICO|nr:histidine phosphatase family protein [Georgenia satyanarayanai]PYF99144.1 putative phosphoglycerate mutase [Georgenia satyanarayanai]SSA43262.1 probable phosphoglycerate mutase [Georgenia satyanarayanai]